MLYLIDYVITFYKLLLSHPASCRFITPYRSLLYHTLQPIALSHPTVLDIAQQLNGAAVQRSFIRCICRYPPTWGTVAL